MQYKLLLVLLPRHYKGTGISRTIAVFKENQVN